jgi:hypothetical protein
MGDPLRYEALEPPAYRSQWEKTVTPCGGVLSPFARLEAFFDFCVVVALFEKCAISALRFLRNRYAESIYKDLRMTNERTRFRAGCADVC